MREIKFRFWNQGTLFGKMFYDTEQVLECLKQQLLFNDKNHRNNKLGYNHISEGCFFMQFTGLKDKNGKDIYEDDILKITLYDDEWKTRVRNYYGTLIVDVEGYDWNTTALSFLDDDAETEVVGNIHENPELLSTPTAVL